MMKEPIIASVLFAWLGVGMAIFIGQLLVKAACEDLHGFCKR